MCGY
ncbi:hypothetical protein OYC64_005838, partial [Pagothenia borchgrevinki]